MVRTALATLTVAVAVAATGAVLQAVRPPARIAGPALVATQLAADDTTGLLRVASGSARVAADAEGDGASETFTLQQLHDGEVSAEQFAAFWEAALQRIRTAPCPAPIAAGSTRVVVSVGATPPGHLGDAYRDYTPLLSEARAAHASECG